MTEEEIKNFAKLTIPASEQVNTSQILKLEKIVFVELPSAYWTWPLYAMTLGLWTIWRERHRFIITNQRLIVTSGILSKSEKSVQLSRIQDVNVLRSIFTGGRVTITSAGGALSFRAVGPLSRAKAAEFAEIMMGLIPTHGDGLSSPRQGTDKKPQSVADEIKKLAELRDSGVISEDEFVAHKARLLH